MPYLTELQRIPTTGARAVAAFTGPRGEAMLAVPQLAADLPGTPDGINGGTSATQVLLLRDTPDGFVHAGTLPVGGGEDVEAFEIGGRRFLAVASIRSGSGPYEFATTSPIYEITDDGIELFQEVATVAAKQWRAFTIGDEHFLALAQGHPQAGGESSIMRWTGGAFEKVQDIPTGAGYNFGFFELDGSAYLAYADHVRPAVLFRYGGTGFVKVQDLVPSGGRAFQLFTQGGVTYLAVARIDGDSLLWRWDGTGFVDPKPLPGGPGGREFELLDGPDGTFLLRIDFIHGSPAQPVPDLLSLLYRVENGIATPVEWVPTSGGTDATLLPGDGIRIAVSNGLAPDHEPGRVFAAETVIYRFQAKGA